MDEYGVIEEAKRRNRSILLWMVIVFGVIILLTIVLWVMVILSMAGPQVFRGARNQNLRNAVQRHYREHGVSSVTLGELMNFDWDRAMYFNASANPQFIYETLGVRFQHTEFVSGMIFVRDGEIVYYEVFPFESMWIDITPLFMVNAYGNNPMRNGTIIYPSDVFEVAYTNRVVRANETQ